MLGHLGISSTDNQKHLSDSRELWKDTKRGCLKISDFLAPFALLKIALKHILIISDFLFTMFFFFFTKEEKFCLFFLPETVAPVMVIASDRSHQCAWCNCCISFCYGGQHRRGKKKPQVIPPPTHFCQPNPVWQTSFGKHLHLMEHFEQRLWLLSFCLWYWM